MQISNNIPSIKSTPNFGKVNYNKEVLEALEKSPKTKPELLDKIIDATKKCADTKFFNINLNVVDGEVNMQMVSLPEAYFGLFEPKNEKFTATQYARDKQYRIDENIVMLGKNIRDKFYGRYGVHKLGIPTNTNEIPYAVWSYSPLKTPDRIDELAEIVLTFDEQAKAVADKNAKEADAKRVADKKICSKIDVLQKMM